jgi:hypothetical protein
LPHPVNSLAPLHSSSTDAGVAATTDPAVADPADRLFFIVGRGRSGTTLLVQLLDAHPAVAMAPEALFVVSLFRRYRRARWDHRTVARFCRDLWHEDRLRRWRLSAAALEQQLRASPNRTYAGMCAQVYAANAAARHKGAAARLGDKNPHHALYLPILMALYPRARFIHLVRDYRDTIVSYRSVPFDAASVPALAERWRLYNEAVLAASARAPDRFLRVQYESLIGEPEACLRPICAFLEVEWTPSVLTEWTIPYWGLVDWHQKLAEPIDPAYAGRWRTALAPREVAVADAICQPLGAELGYPPHGPERARMGLGARAGIAYGRGLTAAERAVMSVPLWLRTATVRAYRRSADNPIE